MITQKTTLNMVIGFPLDHTQSPLLHNTVYQHLKIDAVLMAFAHPEIAPLISAIKTLNVGLIAVTMPFKEAVIPYLDVCTEEAKNLSAVNTIIQKNDALHGYNTDITGIEYALRNVALHQKNVLIIGAGGASRALGYVLKKHQAQLFWLNRTKEKALSLISTFGGQAIDREALHEIHFDVIVNTTPLGMHPNIDQSPIPHEIFKQDQTVFDMIYNPLETKFLKQAKIAGATTVSGIDMFIAQGIQQIALWQNKNIHTTDIEQLAKKAFALKRST